MSPLTRGEWIEICYLQAVFSLWLSPLTRGEWIEIKSSMSDTFRTLSPLTRGEWIEIICVAVTCPAAIVSPHPRGVD